MTAFESNKRSLGDGGNEKVLAHIFPEQKRHGTVIPLPIAGLPTKRQLAPRDRPLTIKSVDAATTQYTSSPLLTLSEVMALLRKSRTSVYRLVETRKIPFIKVGGSIRFARTDLENYLSGSRIAPIT